MKPSYIRLLGVNIPLLVSCSNSTDLPSDEEEDEEEEVYGLWDPNDMTITTNPDCSPVQERVTVLHELLHAIDDFLNLEMTHQEVYVLSQVLYQVIADNPQLVGYLQELGAKEEFSLDLKPPNPLDSSKDIKLTDWEESQVVAEGSPKMVRHSKVSESPLKRGKCSYVGGALDGKSFTEEYRTYEYLGSCGQSWVRTSDTTFTFVPKP